jgi:hypothetical protein
VTTALYGLMAAFDTPDALLEAARRLREDGYRELEAYTPFPVAGLDETLALGPDHVPLLTLLGGLAGTAVAFGGQAWTSLAYWPLNVGGRPNFSWPMFIPITFELAILGAAVAALVGMLWLNGLPELYHPAFNAPHFELASRNRFFLCVRGHDPGFDAELTRRLLEGLGSREVDDVPW